MDEASQHAASNASAQKKNNKKFEEEVSVFLEETPPNKTEVSRAVLEMIKRAERKI
jgi:phosphatidylserine/phosphatidylglycerophosphate/cardiolipin synthase-like enzyme